MKIAYVRQEFPKNSETFLIEEVASLLRAGHEVRVVAQRSGVTGLHARVLESRLFDHIDYEPVAPGLRAGYQHLRQFIGRVRRDHYGAGYWRNLVPDASLATSLIEVLRSSGPRGLARALERSTRLDNLSLALDPVQRPAESPSVAWATALPEAFGRMAKPGLEAFGRMAKPGLEAFAHEFVPDVIHCPFLFAWEAEKVAALSQRYRVPHTITLRACDLYRELPESADQALRLAVLTSAARIITISRFNRDHIMRASDPRSRAAASVSTQIPIVHSGIDTRRFAPDPTVRKVPNQIAAVARLVPMKGLDLLVRAVARLHQDGHQVRCIIVGEGPQRARLAALIREHRLGAYVELRGVASQTEVREILAASTLFVLPCVVDPTGDRDILPNSVKEAMAMQLPVVTSDISGIDELVRDDATGLLVPPGSVPAIASAITSLLADPARRERLGMAARAAVVCDFDSANEAAKLAIVLSEVCEAARRDRGNPGTG